MRKRKPTRQERRRREAFWLRGDDMPDEAREAIRSAIEHGVGDDYIGTAVALHGWHGIGSSFARILRKLLQASEAIGPKCYLCPNPVQRVAVFVPNEPWRYVAAPPPEARKTRLLLYGLCQPCKVKGGADIVERNLEQNPTRAVEFTFGGDA